MNNVPATKYCKGCQVTKLRTEFHKNGKTVHPICKICRQSERKTKRYPRKEGIKKCPTCNTFLDTKKYFNSDQRSPDGLQCYCKGCKELQRYRGFSTFNGFMANLLRDIRGNAKKRGIQVNIVLEDLIDLYKNQDGMCIYTGIKMTHICKERDTTEHIINKWNISVDRINSDKPYQKDNLQLTCAVVNRLKSYHDEEFFLSLCLGIRWSNKNYINSHKYRVHYEKNPIDTNPVTSLFLKTLYESKQRKNIVLDTPIQRWANKNVDNFIKKLHLCTKHGCKGRKRKNITLELSEKDIKDQYIKQDGKCAVTGLKMTRIAHQKKKGKDAHYWNISIDRIDSNKPYTKDNIQLVCNVVNRMKIDMNHKDFILLCKYVSDRINFHKFFI